MLAWYYFKYSWNFKIWSVDMCSSVNWKEAHGRCKNSNENEIPQLPCALSFFPQHHLGNMCRPNAPPTPSSSAAENGICKEQTFSERDFDICAPEAEHSRPSLFCADDVIGQHSFLFCVGLLEKGESEFQKWKGPKSSLERRVRCLVLLARQLKAKWVLTIDRRALL